MAIINFKTTDELLNTLVSNEFIDTYMPHANPTYSLIYIYTLRNSLRGSKPLQIRDIASTFKVLESDVINCFEYWAEKGILNVINEDDSFNIEFLPIIKAKDETREEPLAQKAIIENEVSETEVPPADSLKENFRVAPSYSPKELELYKSSYEDINNLFAFAENTLGKMLNAKDLSVIYSFYDWLKLPLDVIKHLLTYCAGNDHRKLSYIESVAIDWAENAIDTVDKAITYLDVYNKDYRSILKALALGGRNPAPKEIEFIERWLNEYKLPLTIILEACDKTIIQTGKGQFNYVEKILSSWHKEGIKTIDDVKQSESNYKQTAKSTKMVKQAPKRVNRFANFNQRERDYEQMEKLEAEFLLKRVKDKV